MHCLQCEREWCNLLFAGACRSALTACAAKLRAYSLQQIAMMRKKRSCNAASRSDEAIRRSVGNSLEASRT
eukprot:7414171-Pyramimonas_sp.AAC.1